MSLPLSTGDQLIKSVALPPAEPIAHAAPPPSSCAGSASSSFAASAAAASSDESDISLIAPHVYLSGELGAFDVVALVARGIRVVLNVSSEATPPPVREMYDAARITLVHAPMDDSLDQSLAPTCLEMHDILAGVADRASESGETALVHCQLGRSRSVAVVAFHLMHRTQQPYARVMARTIRPARPSAQPNAAFEMQLKQIGVEKGWQM